MALELCSIPSCAKPRHSKGLCSAHVTRLKRCGDPVAPLKRTPQSGSCSVEGCGQPSRKCGWCAAHYSQSRRTGKPPEPFQYKWAERAPCVLCGAPSTSRGRRQFCSSRCQMLENRARRAGEQGVPREKSCGICGDAIDLFESGVSRKSRRLTSTRKRRADTLLCKSCRASRQRRHKYPVKLLRNRDGSDCGICGEPVEFAIGHPDPASPSVDHVIPRGRGGSDEPSNLQLAHLGCNQKKHARMPDQALA